MSLTGGRKPRPVQNQFSRPSVTLDKQDRSWQEVSPLQLTAGDIIPDLGKIVAVTGISREDSTMLSPLQAVQVRVVFLSGDVHDFKGDERIKAFTTGKSPWGALEGLFL